MKFTKANIIGEVYHNVNDKPMIPVLVGSRKGIQLGHAYMRKFSRDIIPTECVVEMREMENEETGETWTGYFVLPMSWAAFEQLMAVAPAAAVAMAEDVAESAEEEEEEEVVAAAPVKKRKKK